MSVQVAEFAHGIRGDARPRDIWVRGPRGGAARTVGEEGDVQARQQPVVGAILEEVEQRHRGGGEAVHEEGFQLAFQEVQGYEGAGEGLEE